MTRVILRVSLEGKGGAQTRLTSILKKHGFKRTGTATHETQLPHVATAYNAINEVLAFLEKEQTPFPLDHLWLYISK